jgi:hypothetical protein
MIPDLSSAPTAFSRVADPENSTFEQDLRESMLTGYRVGNDRENQQGNRPETG